jgi:hypothetical protein
MIKREDIKKGAQFLDEDRDLITIEYVGYSHVFFSWKRSNESIGEQAENINNIIEHCKYPEPKKPRTVEFFEWIGKCGHLRSNLLTKDFIDVKGESYSRYAQDVFLTWTGRSFLLEVDENWGEE